MDTGPFLAAACELLAVRSTADRPGDLRKALDLVAGFVGPGFTVEEFESGGKPSVLMYCGAQRPHFQIILNGHLDVVPAAAAQFRPRREGDRLYARGAQDMKVSALVLAQAFREVAGALPYPLGLQLVTDEEVGGRNGTLHQIQQGVSGEFVIIGEHSGLQIVTDSKGMITATLRAVGRSGHAAYPWRGDNALIKLQASLASLLGAYPPATEEAWRTTVNLAKIQTPNQARNQIPALAEAWLDIRYPPDDTAMSPCTTSPAPVHPKRADQSNRHHGLDGSAVSGIIRCAVMPVMHHYDRREKEPGSRSDRRNCARPVTVGRLRSATDKSRLVGNLGRSPAGSSARRATGCPGCGGIPSEPRSTGRWWLGRRIRRGRAGRRRRCRK